MSNFITRTWRSRLNPVVAYRDREHMAEVVERQMLARGLVHPMGRRKFLLASLATMTAGEILARQARAQSAGTFGQRRAAAITAPPASGLAFPDGYTDAVYTGMSNQSDGSRLTMGSGQTYNKYSWSLANSTSSYTIATGNNATANYFRMRTNEGIRVADGNTTTFNWLFMEVFGDPGDHADGVQDYDPNGPRNVLNYNNCHARAVDGEYTLWFAADNAYALYSATNSLFSSDGNGGNAIVLYNDRGGAFLQIALDTVYFTAANTWSAQQILINSQSGTNPAQVTLWSGVRNCTWNHATKILVPGSTITQPANT